VSPGRFLSQISPSLHDVCSIQGNNFLEREEEEVVKRFPVYYYTDESNYTQKQFSGLHLHYLPASIKAAADEQATIDPRCSIVSETGWVVPEECLEPPEDTGTPCVTPNIPPGPPTKEEECGVDTIQQPSTCRISNTSSTLLYNGLTLHSFVSVDGDIKSTTEDGYNVPKVFISEDDTSLEVEVVAQRDVIVGPKQVQDNIDVYVDEDIWNLLDNFSDIKELVEPSSNTAETVILLLLLKIVTGNVRNEATSKICMCFCLM